MNSEERNRLEELLSTLMESSLSDSGQKELDSILLNSEEAREYYNDYIDTHIALDWHFGDKSLDLPSGLEPMIGQKPKKKAPILILAGPLIAAAAILAFIFIIPKKNSARDSIEEYTLLKSVSADWDKKLKYKVGDSIDKGIHRLHSGYCEISNNKGVKLIVEGPAEFELISSKKVKLQKGTLVATVESEAIGFEVDTPKTNVLDLGTEFGVKVSDNGDTEIHVLEGKVETRTGKEKKLIHKSEASVITAKNTVAKQADAGRFMRILPEKPNEKISYIHWPLNEGMGKVSAYKGENIEDKDYDAYLSSTHKNGTGPQWIDGKFQGGINFDGQGNYLETGFPGIGGAHARTVAFWTKIPKDVTTEQATSMVAWGSYLGKGKTWQVSWNWQEKDGNMGAIRAGLYHGQIVGTQDLRDDKWHHIAVVMFGDGKPNVNTHILLYVDGRLEPASRKSILDVKTDIDSKLSTNVLMGRDAMAHIYGKKQHKVFKGMLDEVYIFNFALDDEQIRQLMEYNKFVK